MLKDLNFIVSRVISEDRFFDRDDLDRLRTDYTGIIVDGDIISIGDDRTHHDYLIKSQMTRRSIPSVCSMVNDHGLVYYITDYNGINISTRVYTDRKNFSVARSKLSPLIKEVRKWFKVRTEIEFEELKCKGDSLYISNNVELFSG